MNATHGSSWEIVSLATPPQGGTLTLPNFIDEDTDLGWLNHLHEVTQSQNSNLGLCDFRVHAIFTMLHFWHNWRDTFSKCTCVFKTLSNTVSLFLRYFQTQWFICSFIIHSSTIHPSIIYKHFLSIRLTTWYQGYKILCPQGSFKSEELLIGTVQTLQVLFYTCSNWRQAMPPLSKILA